jgi:hypothetical protein
MIVIELLNNKYALIIFIIIAFIYNIIVYNSKVSIFMMFIVLAYFYNLYDIGGKVNSKEYKNDIDRKDIYLDNIFNKEILIHSGDTFYLQTDLYNNYKKSKNLDFLKNNYYLKNIIYDFRFIKKFNKEGYFKLIVLCDNFLNYYYNIISDNLDNTNISILIDTRNELMNVIYNFMIDAPMYSKEKKKRLDIKIHNLLIKVQSYTYKKLKNVNKKYPDIAVNNPRPTTQNDLNDRYKIIL